MTPHCGLHIELGCVVVARPLPEVQDTQTLSIMGALGRMCLRVVGVAGCCKSAPALLGSSFSDSVQSAIRLQELQQVKHQECRLLQALRKMRVGSCRH